jgi:hypothetical protein
MRARLPPIPVARSGDCLVMLGGRDTELRAAFETRQDELFEKWVRDEVDQLTGTAPSPSAG